MKKYNPLKEVSARVTIDRLLTIYQKAGLDVSVYNISKINKKSNIFSCFVNIDGTVFSSNGKGSTIQYSYASGLAELMERLENLTFEGSLYMSEPDIQIFSTQDFLTRRKDLAGENFFRLYTRENDKIDKKIPYSKILEKMQASNQSGIKCLPYYDVNNDKVIQLPIQVKKTSNGMAAGNTPEEALVQGISELFERYIQAVSLKNNFIFPKIPKSEYDKEPKILKMIEQFEKLGFKLEIRDASLGKKFPVVCVVMIDPKTAKYNVHFGAQPVLEIAIERTLTEIAQGKPLSYDNIISKSMLWQDLYPNDKIDIDEIKRDCFRFGYAIVKPDFFTSKPSWEYDAGTWYKLSQKVQNKEMLKNFLKICKSNDFSIFVRDASFLDFPAFHIVIPQLSFAINKTAAEYYQDCLDNEVLFENSKNKNVQKLKIILNFPNKGNLIHYYLLPTYIMKKKYESAQKLLSRMLKDEKIDDYFEKKELKCLYDYINLLINKYPSKELNDILKRFYEQDLIKKVEKNWINSKNPIINWKINKNDLKVAVKSQKIYNKILKYYLNNNPKQENLSKIFKKL